jgi:hypothetical protein
MKQIHVRCAAGAKRLHGESVATALAQVMKQQTREQRLANAGIGARDEYESRLQVA